MDRGRDHKDQEFEGEIKAKMTKTQTSWETEPLSCTPLWKLPLGQNPSFWSLFHIYHLSMKRSSPGIQPLPPHRSLETTFPKSLDAGLKACTPPSVWALIIWLGLCHIKPWAVKDSPEEKAERDGEREMCTTTHLCRAKIVTNQMAPH